MTDIRRIMGIQSNKVRLSKDTPDTVNGQDPDFKPLPAKKKDGPYRYAVNTGAVSPINKALNSKLA